jgi:hypothetical protein
MVLEWEMACLHMLQRLSSVLTSVGVSSTVFWRREGKQHHLHISYVAIFNKYFSRHTTRFRIISEDLLDREEFFGISWYVLRNIY